MLWRRFLLALVTRLLGTAEPHYTPPELPDDLTPDDLRREIEEMRAQLQVIEAKARIMSRQ